MPHEPVPPKPSPGDPLRLPAGFMARLIDLVRRGEHPEFDAAGLSNVRGSPEPLVIRVYNNTTVDLEQYEAIGVEYTRYAAWVSQWLDGAWAYKRLPTADRPLFDGETPKYRNWGITQEPIKAGGIGRVVVRGYTLAKITIRRDAADNLLSAWRHVDIHPDPTGDRETHRLSIRTHGAGVVCGAKTLNINTGEGDEDYIAPIWIDAQPGIARIYRKESAIDALPSSVYIAEDNDFGAAIDSTDPMGSSWIEAPDDMGLLPGLGLDDVSASEVTYGLAVWEPGRATATGKWRIVHWPDPIPAMLDENFEFGVTVGGTTKGSKWAEFHLATSPGGSGVGPAFTATPSPTNHSDSAFTPPDQRVFSLYAPADVPIWIDRWGDMRVEPFMLHPPFGSLRSYWDVAISGTGPCDGWYWCDGSSHPDAPDFNGRFLVGQGAGQPTHLTDPFPSHGSGTYGGEAIHGGDHNDHDDHAINSHTITKDTIYPAGGSAVDVVTDVTPTTHDDLSHTETDNEPRWAAVAWAIRLPEPPAP